MVARGRRERFLNEERAVRTNKKAALVAAVSAALFGQLSRAATEDYEWKGLDGTNPTLWDLSSLNWDRTAPTPATGVAWSNNVDPTTPNRASFLIPAPPLVTVNGAIDTS